MINERPRRSIPCAALLIPGLFLLAAASDAHAQEWTRFRGPNGSGVNATATIPTTWSEKDFRWKVELPGGGHSSPVLWGTNLFVTCADQSSGSRTLLCIDATSGATRWKREFASHTFRQHGDNSYASATPAVDADHVYLDWNTPDALTLLAVNLDGTDAWKADLGPFISQHGGGNSPAIVGDVVLIGDDNEGKESFLFGFDRKSGKQLWKTPRRSDKFSAATPCLFEPPGGAAQAIFTSKAHGMTAIDPATGMVVWELPDLFDVRTVSSPVTANGLVFATCGEGAGGHVLVAVRPGDGKSVAPRIAYSIKQDTPYVPTPIVVKDSLFICSDSGMVTCARAATGVVLWHERIGGSYYASPVCDGASIFYVSKKGEVVAFAAAADRFKLLGRTRLDLDAKCHSTPALANGDLYVRTLSHLACIAGHHDAAAR